jgi:hypothetical protein
MRDRALEKKDLVRNSLTAKGNRFTVERMASAAGDGHLNKRIARDNKYLFSREQILKTHEVPYVYPVSFHPSRY